MGYASGSNCYATVGEALNSQKWLMGHDSILVIGGAAHRLQYTPQQWGDDTQYVLRQVITRLSDEVVIEDTQLIYQPVSCGTLDPSQFGITPASMVQTIGWGFGVVLLGWMLGYSIGVATGLIRKV